MNNELYSRAQETIFFNQKKIDPINILEPVDIQFR